MNGTFLFIDLFFPQLWTGSKKVGNRFGYLKTIKLWHKNEPIGLPLNSRPGGNV